MTPKKTRVLFLCYEFPPLGGGAGNAAYHLSREWAKDSGLEIDVVTSAAGPGSEERLSDGARLFRIDIGKRGGLHRQSLLHVAAYAWKSYWLSRRLQAERPYDLAHAFFGVPSGAVALTLGLPYVVSLRGSDVPGFNPRFKALEPLFLEPLARVIWSRARRVVANSAHLAALAGKTWNGPIEVVRNGVDADAFRPADAAPEAFTVISTSRLTPRKGLDALVRAFGRFSKGRPARLMVVGGGEQDAELKRLAASMPHARIEFLGEAGREELPALYRQASAFALPSRNEGMSNSLLEAAASGLALVATDVGDARSALGDAIVATDGSEDSILSALESLSGNPALLGEMRDKARKRALSLGWQAPARAYKEIFAAAVGETQNR